jgi:hypothetical protein
MVLQVLARQVVQVRLMLVSNERHFSLDVHIVFFSVCPVGMQCCH